MSKLILGPDRPARVGLGHLVGLVHRAGRWTPPKVLAGAAAALALVAFVAPALGRDEGRNTGADTSAGNGRLTAGDDRPTTGITTTPVAPGSAASVPTRGTGTIRVVPVPGGDSPASGRTVRYTVEVEDGAGVDEADYARFVREVLTDERGWESQDHVHFVNVSPERAASDQPPDIRITVASPATVDELCAPMETEGQVSCNNGDRVALNSVRWTRGVPYYPDDLLHYRIYLINHEVGHAIGYDHEDCPGPGRPAPVMLQQTLGLQGCTRYPWPVPGQQL